MRDKIEAVVTAWERRAKAEMHLDALLHKKTKADLINALAAVIEESPPMLTADVVRKATATARESAIKPKADGTIEVHPAPPGQPDEAAQMAALKASLKKGKRA